MEAEHPVSAPAQRECDCGAKRGAGVPTDDIQCRHFDGRWLVTCRVYQGGTWRGLYATFRGVDPDVWDAVIHYYGVNEAAALAAFYAAEEALLRADA